MQPTIPFQASRPTPLQCLEDQSSLLDSQETADTTPAHSPGTAELYQRYNLVNSFCHTGWAHDRRRIWLALAEADVGPSRIRRFAQCCSVWYLFRHKKDRQRYQVAPNHCRDRFCVVCGRARQARIAENLARYLQGTTPRLLTLTLRHTNTPLTDQLDRLYASFRKLRQTPIFRNHADGGIAFLELTIGKADGLWHPHLHILLLGGFIPQAAIRAQWLAITGDSDVVDIRSVKAVQEAVRYVAKYATKPATAGVIRSPVHLREAVTALAGRRMLLAFGCCSRWTLARSTEPTHWEFLTDLFPESPFLESRPPLEQQACLHLRLYARGKVTAEFHSSLDPPDSSTPPRATAST